MSCPFKVSQFRWGLSNYNQFLQKYVILGERNLSDLIKDLTKNNVWKQKEQQAMWGHIYEEGIGMNVLVMFLHEMQMNDALWHIARSACYCKVYN